MLSIRSIARSTPRAVSRLTISAILRPVARPSLFQTSWKPAATQFASAFSTSNTRWAKAEGDAELVAKLEQELAFEAEVQEEDNTPTTVSEYLENSPFELEDTPGQEEVVLKRKFGDER
jgi:complement component 1 Q subcomponent-binding protein